MVKHAYSTVIVTRNRLDALSLSLPLILSQTRPPDQLIVVDSSDDPQAIKEIVNANQLTFEKDITFVPCRPGMTIQRNVGLELVSHPVVFFPDDDSLLFPNTMEEILAIYDRDTAGLVGGVCAAEATEAPPGALGKSSYRMRRSDAIRRSIMPSRRRLERIFVPHPFLRTSELRYRTLQAPDWIGENETVLVEWMTGFRMSFRTHVVRRFGFEESLGRYALAEDVDASFNTLRSRVLVGARRARIYHHKAPARRDNGYSLGAMQVLNYTYIISKQNLNDSILRRQLTRFMRYKYFQYLASSNSEFGRDRLDGIRKAMGYMDRILSAEPDEKRHEYRRARIELGLGE